VSLVLVVEDDPTLCRALALTLDANQLEVHATSSGEDALAFAGRHRPDVVILDLGLPGIDGIQVAAALRAWGDVQILVLSSWDAEQTKIAALDAGADDYVTKPFSMDELLARVRAAVRRAGHTDEGPTAVITPHFRVDLAAKRVTGPDGEIRLTPTEWNVLETLVENRGTLVSQLRLLKEVWGPSYEHETHYLRLYISQLRRKIEPDPSHPRYLITEAGRGYRFDLPDEPGSGWPATPAAVT
jgi:two-component system KDP operon response regulator KdpE